MFRCSVLIVFLCAGALSGCSKDQDAKYLGYIEGKYTYLSSKVSGHLIALPIHKGETVKAGSLAYVLDPEPERSQLDAAKAKLEADEHQLANLKRGQRPTILHQLEANIKEAQSAVTFAKKMYHRDRVLIKTNAIGQAQLDKSKDDFQRAKEKLNAAESALAEGKQGARQDEILAQASRVKAAKADVAHLTWVVNQKRGYIPKSGMIDDTFYRVGEFVPVGKSVASLLTPENRILVFFIPEKKLSQLKVGAKIAFTCDSCDQATHATVTYIGSRAEYTPPVIYSKDSRDKLVYYIEAKIDPKVVTQFHPGQPVEVSLKDS